jgi:hypothetical protein
MTWLGDRIDQPKDAKREKLLAKRAKLVKEVEVLSMKPLTSKTATAARFRHEDLTALATKIHNIDKQLGRSD